MKQEIFKMWMSKLSATLFFDLPEKSMIEFYRLLNHIPDDQFAEICQSLCVDFQPTNYKRFPSISDFNAQRAAIMRRMNDRPPDMPIDGLASFDESKAFLRILDEIKAWHSAGFVAFNKDGCAPMDLETWHIQGRPKTWSPILDKLFQKLCDDVGGHRYAEICNTYNSKLRAERLRRLAEKQQTEGVKNESD